MEAFEKSELIKEFFPLITIESEITLGHKNLKMPMNDWIKQKDQFFENFSALTLFEKLERENYDFLILIFKKFSKCGQIEDLLGVFSDRREPRVSISCHSF